MKVLLLIYFICSCLLVLIAFIIFVIIVYSFWTAPTEPTTAPTFAGRMTPFIGSKDLRVPVGRALQICEEEGMFLPLPRSRKEMGDIVELIKSKVNEATCNFVPFGYTADPRIRYLSLDGSQRWPALDFNQSSALPSLDRDCVQLSDDHRVLAVIPCHKVKTNCSIGLEMTKEVCVDHRYSCASVRSSDAEENIVDRMKIHSDSEMSSYGIAIVDPDHVPVGITTSQFQSPACLTLGAKYELQFRSIYDDSAMPFHFSDFDIPDPEYNCLGVAVKRDYSVTTAACATEACIVCV